jgi:hypothetical protein
LFDPAFVKLTAQALGTDPSHIEKDWHVVRALSVIAGVQVSGVTPVFSGGTSLAAAWRIISRFSEDIDFKVIIDAPNPSAARTRRSKYRESVIEALVQSGFVLDGDVMVGNMSRFFHASFHYGASLPAAAGIRPTLQIEMTFAGTLMGPTAHPVQSLLARAAKAAPEVPSLMCVDPVETAADKVGALAWRTAVRDRTSTRDDPSVVRHIHDLAALAATVEGNAAFAPLARRVLAQDAARTKIAGADGLALLRAMLPAITGDSQWRDEYDVFVQAVSFGPDADRIGFDDAIAACGRLVSRLIAS